VFKAQATTLVRRHVDDCFRFVADDFFHNYPRWSPEVVELTPLSRGPVRVGSLARQVRVDFGRRSADTFRVIALERGRRLTFEGISSPFLIDFRFATLDRQTRLVFTFSLSRLDLWMRPLERGIRRAAQEGAERVVDNLKGLIETDCAGGTG
jgi:hypothetical protein